ncbi:MAG: YccF domain-containing protein, partial [Actinomycetes bacterium]
VKTIGNIIWFVFSGLWMAMGFVLLGALLCITIIGIPFGVQAFKLAGFALWPFGREVVRTPASGGCLEVLFNVLWLCCFGWGFFLAGLMSALVLCVTIIGIPFAVPAIKIGVLGLWPFGRTVVEARDQLGP